MNENARRGLDGESSGGWEAGPARRRRWLARLVAVSLVIAIGGLGLAPLALADEADAQQSAAPPPRQGNDNPIGDQIFDAAVLRPLGAISVFVGSLFFVASSPLTAIDWNFEDSWDFYVQPSWEYTFTRELGDL